MLQQDFGSDEDQNDASCNHCLLLKGTAQPLAEEYSQIAERKGNYANEAGAKPDVGGYRSKADAHRQGVDTGGDGED